MMAREYQAAQAAQDTEQPAAPAVLVPGPGYVPSDAPCFIHAVHPDHGEPVTYVPGERLPGWVRENMAAGALLVPEAQNVARLGPVPKGKR